MLRRRAQPVEGSVRESATRRRSKRLTWVPWAMISAWVTKVDRYAEPRSAART